MTLHHRPTRLRLIQHRYFRDVVQPKQRLSVRPPHVEGHRDHDSSQPSRESCRLLQIGEPTKGSQVGLLDGILRDGRVAQHPHRNPVRHRLSGVHELVVGVHVARLSCDDQMLDGLHVFSHWKDTGEGKV